ncbi:MAG: SIMPL domain-containing protein [Alphaproteobacteria bacterium]|nr:SIMPL domain-containing protein [Alphaproteobacteria bacterium]
MRLPHILLVLMLSASPVFAQNFTPTSGPVLTMSGIGEALGAPDIALIDIGVELRAPTAEQALRQNSGRMKDVFALLAASGIKPRDIQTSQFSLFPQWEDQKSPYNKPLQIVGFKVTNALNVRVRDLAQLGSILDALTKAGANRIQSVRFSVDNSERYLDAARRAAVVDAIRKAKITAKAAGVSLGAILSISESRTSNPEPVFRMSALAADTVPISGGELKFTAGVTIRFALE